MSGIQVFQEFLGKQSNPFKCTGLANFTDERRESGTVFETVTLFNTETHSTVHFVLARAAFDKQKPGRRTSRLLFTLVLPVT